VFIYVQIPWGGFGRNSYEAGLKDVGSFGLDSLYAYCPKKPDAKHPTLAWDYFVDGTPWTIVIDREGTVRYTDRTTKAEPIDAVIKKSLEPKK
jgi:hypothetical protein